MWKKQFFRYAKILQLVCISIVILLILFSVALYLSVKKTMLENEYRTNETIYGNFIKNFENLNEDATALCVGQFLNADNQAVMMGKKSDYERLYTAVRNFSNIITANHGILSASMYNGQLDRYYGIANGAHEQTNEFENILQSEGQIEKLKPIPRKISRYDQESYTKVISYAMFDETDERGMPVGGVLINYDFRWFYDFLSSQNQLDSRVIVMGENGQIILDNNNLEQINVQAGEELMRLLQNVPLHKSSVEKFEGEKLVVSKFESDIGWDFIFLQEYEGFFYYVELIRIQIWGITAFFLLVAIGLSIFLTYHIYTPMKNIVHSAVDDGLIQNPDEMEDIMKTLSGMVNVSKNKIQEYQNRLRELHNEENIKRLLIYGKNPNNLMIKGTVILFKLSDKNIDNYKMIYVLYLLDMIKGYMLLIQEKYEVILMDNSEILLIAEAEYNKMLETVKMIVDDAALCEVYLCAAVSHPTQNTKEFYNAFINCKNMVRYRMIYGEQCVITEEDVNAAEKNDFCYMEREEKHILQHVLDFSYDISQLEKDVQQFINLTAANNRIDSFYLAVNRLLIAIQNKVFIYNNGNVVPVAIEFDKYSLMLSQMETKEELVHFFLNLIQKINNDGKSIYAKRSESIAKKINTYIEENYSRLDLCADKIADDFHIPKKRLSQMYREETGVQLSEAILKIRINKVAFLLINSDYSIKKIMLVCGFENESNFYKVFKKFFAVTPKQYRENYQGKGL